MQNTKIFTNLSWRFFERFGAQGVSLIVSIILARLLTPEVYGTIALVTVFTTILNVFVDSGLGNALIQKKDADDIDFSSVFFFNFAMCLLLYAVMYVVAPFIARFYEMPELTKIVRALSLTLVISGIKNIQQAYVTRRLLFKKFFFSTLGGTVVAAVIGIWMAYQGYGVWALVAQQLINATIDTIILWITVKWRPKYMFSFSRLKGLLSYGWKLLVSALLDTLYNDIRQLIIGKFYSSLDLAFYNQGKKYPNLFASNINASIDSVLFPVMSCEQENKDRIKEMTRRAIKTSVYLMAPIMCGMCATATSLVSLILTDKWLPCVPYLRVFCIIFIFHPVHTANLNAIKALGRSDLFLKLEIIKKVEGAIVLLLTIWFGPFVIACSGLATTCIGQLINAWPNKKLLGYPYKEQFLDILPTLFLAAAMCAGVWTIELLPLCSWQTLLIQVIAGVSIYTGGSVLLRIDSFYYCIHVGKCLIHIRKKDEDKRNKTSE